MNALKAEMPDAAWSPLARDYLAAVGHTTSASEHFHLAVFLTIAGTVLGRSVYVTDPHPLYPNFFTALVGESAYSKKGTAMKYGKSLLRQTGTDVLSLVSVDSAEGLIEHLSQHQTRQKTDSVSAMLHFPEMRSLIDKANQKSTRSIIPKLSEAYDCEDLQLVVRNNPVRAENTFTALMGGAAPEWLENLTANDLEGGIGNRFLWVPGPSREPLHKRPPVNREKWDAVVKALKEARTFWAGDRGQRDPSRVELSSEAETRMEQFGKFIYRTTREDPLISKLCGRMEGHCAKISLVHSGLDLSPRVELPHLERSIAFCQFLLESLYEIFSEYGLSETVKQERKFVEAITAKPGITIRELQRIIVSGRVDTETFHRRLRWMTAEGGPIVGLREGRSIRLYPAGQQEPEAPAPAVKEVSFCAACEHPLRLHVEHRGQRECMACLGISSPLCEHFRQQGKLCVGLPLEGTLSLSDPPESGKQEARANVA